MPLTEHRSQHGVHETRCARLACSSRQDSRIVNDGGGRNAIEMEQLKETQAEDGEDLRVDLREWPFGKVLDEMVEGALPARRAGDDGGGERAIAVVVE